MMKKILFACKILGITAVIASFVMPQQQSITGAWMKTDNGTETVLIIHDNYLAYTEYDKGGKKFFFTKGGICNLANGKLSVRYEFNSKEPAQVGTSADLPFTMENDKLVLTHNGAKETYTRIDDNKGPLAGAWRISGRMQNGEMRTMNPGARKTYKILSGTRFQWVAMNTETKQMSGTGGGAYTFENGKYTEQIEFFSRDSSRVGASLRFDGSVNNNVWTHKGLSSRGEPIHEEWTKVH